MTHSKWLTFSISHLLALFACYGLSIDGNVCSNIKLLYFSKNIRPALKALERFLPTRFYRWHLQNIEIKICQYYPRLRLYSTTNACYSHFVNVYWSSENSIHRKEKLFKTAGSICLFFSQLNDLEQQAKSLNLIYFTCRKLCCFWKWWQNLYLLLLCWHVIAGSFVKANHFWSEAQKILW